MALLTRRFKKFIKRKEVRRTDQGDRERKPNNKEEERRCFNCDKVGYIAANCRVKQNKGKKAFAATWDDEDDELDISDSEVSEFGFIASIDNEQNDYLDEDVTDGDIYTAFENADPRAVLCLWMFFWMAILCWFGLSMPIGYSSLINAPGLIFWDLICFMPPTTMSLSHQDSLLKILALESESKDSTEKLQEEIQKRSEEVERLQEEVDKHEQHRDSLEKQVGQLQTILEEKEQLVLRSVDREKELEDKKTEADKAVQEMERNCDQKLAEHKEESPQYLMHIQEEHAALYFREDLHRRLLSTDFKMQVDGIEMLHKVLEFLPKLFDMLRIEWYTLTVSEAAIFLPCLVEKVGKGKSKAVPIPNIVEASSVNQEGELTELSLVGGPSAITTIGSPEASVNDIIITNVEKAGSILCTLPVKNHYPGDPSLLQLAIIQPNSMVEAASDVVNERDHSDDSPFTPVLSKKAAKKAAKAAKIENLSSSKGKS
ncbi:hypothetical protein RHGRI_026516 [Rhododendron griersonianum]|uniref:CCHC-type domain-containing protein n=1 Tax=Rhododendron griersonianum TaxID=479676 RepID=A0AAV6IY46_9ERIC|nr:hypothetical protein RHGRI_026516 [Rhododendron griersonianum]